ncbi:MAG: histidinol dehydrogenase, partial [bacterium]
MQKSTTFSKICDSVTMIKILKGNEFSAQVKQDLFARSGKLQEQVAEIIHQVTRKGDQALLDYTSKFDRVDLEHLRVPQSAIKAAGENLTPRVREIITSAIENIQDFHKKQVTDSWKVKKDDGTVLGQIVRPIDRVGVYIPGGRAVYPSTLLMNVIPAQIAGVESIVAVSPPMKNGLPNELVLAGCALLGVEEVYAIGGAHSIAALAFGTDTIKPVCKITGPGNQYVAEAKRQVFGTVGIDSVAGPSEILILHDDLTIPVEYLVRDMLSQAEHDAEASSILVTTSQETAEAVKARLEEIVPDLPRRELIQPSLENHGAIIVVDEIDEGIEIS